MCRYWRSSLPLINSFWVIYKIILSVSKNAPTVDASFFCFIKDTADHIGAFLFLGLIQMGIDIRRCGQVGVPEEGRYIQQRHILIDKDAGEGVAQIVEPNLAQTVLLDKVGEPLRDPIRAYQPAELIDADIIVVFAVVAALEHSAVQVLLFPFLAQHFIHRVRQRQCAAAGFVFHFLHRFDDDLAVFLILNDFGVEQYGFLFPIYSRPPCAQRLAAAQPQAARQHNRRIDNIPADKPEQGNQFFFGIVFSVELVFLRAVDAVKGIGVNQSVLWTIAFSTITVQMVSLHSRSTTGCFLRVSSNSDLYIRGTRELRYASLVILVLSFRFPPKHAARSHHRAFYCWLCGEQHEHAEGSRP